MARIASVFVLLWIAIAGASDSVVEAVAADIDSTSTEQEYPEALEVEDNSIYPEFPDAPADAPTARLRVVFDTISEEKAKFVEPRVPFEFFIVAYDVQVALRGWEAKLVLDPRLLLLEHEFEGLNVGQGTEIITALTPKECKAGSPITLARFKAMLPNEGLEDVVISLAPVTKSSFDPPTPGYLVCRPGSDLRVFDACDTCAVVNPVHLQPEEDAVSPLDAVLKPIRGR